MGSSPSQPSQSYATDSSTCLFTVSQCENGLIVTNYNSQFHKLNSQKIETGFTLDIKRQAYTSLKELDSQLIYRLTRNKIIVRNTNDDGATHVIINLKSCKVTKIPNEVTNDTGKIYKISDKYLFENSTRLAVMDKRFTMLSQKSFGHKIFHIIVLNDDLFALSTAQHIYIESLQHGTRCSVRSGYENRYPVFHFGNNATTMITPYVQYHLQGTQLVPVTEKIQTHPNRIVLSQNRLLGIVLDNIRLSEDVHGEQRILQDKNIYSLVARV